MCAPAARSNLQQTIADDAIICVLRCFGVIVTPCTCVSRGCVMKGERVGSAPRGTEVPVVVPVGGNGDVSAESVSVDKIRDLLFGNQMQDYDRRFAQLEERFLQRFKEIESETSRNLGAFES